MTLLMVAASLSVIVPSASFADAAGPITPPLTLYMRSTPTGVGNADLVLSGNVLSPDAPTGDTPAVYHSIFRLAGTNPNTVYDANWRWRPTDGYNMEQVEVKVVFWAASPGGALDINGYLVSLWSNGIKVIEATVDDTDPSTSGTPTEWTLLMGPTTLTGNDLTLQINPNYVDADAANIIVYDSVDYPSRVEFLGGDDTTPPSQVTGLSVTGTTSNTASLAWNAATDDRAVAHYKVYRDGVAVATSPGTSYTDAGLAPLTTYAYAVSAVDAAGNEGALSTSVNAVTLAPDNTPPQITGPTASAGATVARISWTTDEPTTGVLDFGATVAYDRQFTTALGTSHAVTVTGLSPGSTYHAKVTATDTAGNAASTGDVEITTSTTQTLYLHNKGPVGADVSYMNEFDETDDNEARGFNILGSAIATAHHATGVEPPVIGTAMQVFPAANPANPAQRVNTSRNIEATLYVRFTTSGPTVGTLYPQSIGLVSLNLTLFANGGQVLGGQVIDRIVQLDQGYVPLQFSFAPNFRDVDAGTLAAVVKVDKATTAYLVGFQGAAASNIRLPIEPGLPLSATASVDTTTRPMEDAPVQFSALASGGIGPFTYAWTFSDGATATGATPSHTFATPGFHTATVTITDAENEQASAIVGLRVLQRDFVNNSRVVVAVIDTGINPYHTAYQRPGIDLPLNQFLNASNGLAPREVQLTFGTNYDANVAADNAIWNGIGVQELVYFKGTNVLGITMGRAGKPILDDNGHGTATSDTVLRNFPDAIIVAVEHDAAILSSGIPTAFEWAARQPWIDVISASLGTPGNAPEPLFLYQAPQFQKLAVDSGKIWVESAGNDPSPLFTDGLDSPWAFVITGSQQGGKGKEIMSSNTYPDYASNYTVLAATHTSVAGEDTIGGTSFSCPTVAGTVAGIVHTLRTNAGYVGGISGGKLVPTTGVTNHVIRDALNKTAVYQMLPGSGYPAGLNYNGDHGIPPVAPWLVHGWGHVDASIIPSAVTAIETNDLAIPLAPNEKGLAKPYMQASHRLRETYWSYFANPNGFTGDVHGPGAQMNVMPVATVETPHPYPRNANLAWSISAPGAAGISVHFERFSVETGYDLVTLEMPDGTIVGVYSLDGGSSFWSAYVPGDEVVVRLTSDGGVERYGFVINEIDAPGATATASVQALPTKVTPCANQACGQAGAAQPRLKSH